jgi:dolichyl-phosphate beta-glucosyltransferase
LDPASGFERIPFEEGSGTDPGLQAAPAAPALQVSVVVPAYNEGERIGGSLEAICRHLEPRVRAFEVIPVDDGSLDGTAEAIARAAARLGPRVRPLASDRHRGKGSAVRSGMLAAQGDVMIYLDADLSIPVTILDVFLEKLHGGHDLAVASRFVPGSARDATPRFRRVMSLTYRALVRHLLVDRFSDTQCGAKAYRREVARDLFSRQRLDGFAFDAEILYLAARRGYRVAEVPVSLDPSARSSVRFLDHSLPMVMDLLRVRYNAFLGRYD